jgi:hypothetical protein
MGRRSSHSKLTDTTLDISKVYNGGSISCHVRLLDTRKICWVYGCEILIENSRACSVRASRYRIIDTESDQTQDHLVQYPASICLTFDTNICGFYPTLTTYIQRHFRKSSGSSILFCTPRLRRVFIHPNSRTRFFTCVCSCLFDV